ncbi:3-dehydroquinate synthase [Gluconacetobacter diazotrophicus]|uniref:Multifunctional fusion protein n=1 Tax=Gluconacetobacter diazotrophicus TaxID=33996 RepID=A0A7W4FBV7_GLUDI|nr:3-dehydroquinate synthase [Gluconacetobacter diazotrophicus]MBB2154881.1 3-dehydroquinate synthase [Gluconacetobacter diazotrophicus]
MSRPIEPPAPESTDLSPAGGRDAPFLAFDLDALVAADRPDRPGPRAPGPHERSVVLVGLMGAGKTTIGRRIAARLGMPFVDADVEIERAAGCSIADLFRRYGEAEFRKGEHRVIRRILSGHPLVLATGGGAFMDPVTRAVIRDRATSVWLRCPLPVLVRRVQGRTHRPLLNEGNPRDILAALMEIRHPVYAEANITVDCGEESVDQSAATVISALTLAKPPRLVPVILERWRYDVTIGEDLLRHAGILLAPVLPQKRVVVVTDSTVAALHLPRLLAGLAEGAIRAEKIVVPPGEGSKTMAEYERVTNALLDMGVERGTTVIALGGGVVGDLAGFAAATTLRGLPFVQIPTTLLSQVDSSVGGKTGINTPFGKNLLGAFHQPLAVLVDTTTLSSLPAREVRAGYAEIVKSGLIGDAALFEWCEANGQAVLDGDADIRAEAVRQACAFKAHVVGDDEREEKKSDGRALLNLGHTFGHALEAELGYDGRLLHGEAVSIGLRLAFLTSVRMGFCDRTDLNRVTAHLERLGMPARISDVGETFSADRLIAHMQRDKKMRDGRLSFVLVRGIGQAFTCRDVPDAVVRDILLAEGCAA